MQPKSRYMLAALLVLMIAYIIAAGSSARQSNNTPPQTVQMVAAHHLLLPIINMTLPITEITIHNLEVTASWPSTSAPGITVQHLPGWEIITSTGGLIGYQGLTMRAPVCSAQQTSGCVAKGSPPAFVRISVQSLALHQDRPTEFLMESLLRHGYTRRQILLHGLHGWLLEPGPQAQPNFETKLVIQLGLYDYLVERSPAAARLDPDMHNFRLLLGTFKLDTASAPAAPPWKIDLHEQKAPSAAPDPNTSALGLLFYYGELYGAQHTNYDGCYIHANGVCFDPVAAYADGAHYLDCVIHLVDQAINYPERLSPTSCQASQSIIGMHALYQALQRRGAQTISEAQALPGDLVFLITSKGLACWGGMIMQRGVDNGSGFLVAFHSNVNAAEEDADTITADIEGMWCEQNIEPTRVFLRVYPDMIKPVATWQSPADGPVHMRVPIDLIGTATDNQAVRETVISVSMNGGPFNLLQRGASTTYSFTPTRPCTRYVFQIQAFDQVNNPSDPAYLTLQTTLVGDFDLNGQVQPQDELAMDQLWRYTTISPDFEPALDLSGDGAINGADRLRLTQLFADTCSAP